MNIPGVQAPPTPATTHERFFGPGVLAETQANYHAAYLSCLHRVAPAITAPVAVYINRANLDLFLKAAPVSLSGRRDGER